jgi:hypothetical protein
MAAKPDIQFVDNPLAPELYASGATGFFVSNGIITSLWNPSAPTMATSRVP